MEERGGGGTDGTIGAGRHVSEPLDGTSHVLRQLGSAVGRSEAVGRTNRADNSSNLCDSRDSNDVSKL